MINKIRLYKEIKTAGELGNVLRQIRKSDGFSIEEASDLTGLGCRFISEAERGKASASLSKILDISTAYGLRFFIYPRAAITGKLPYGEVKSSKEIGEILRYHRKDQSATLTDVVELSHFNLRFLSDFENGRPNIRLEKALLALAEYGLELLVKIPHKEA